jgi:hypothetical protein
MSIIEIRIFIAIKLCTIWYSIIILQIKHYVVLYLIYIFICCLFAVVDHDSASVSAQYITTWKRVVKELRVRHLTHTRNLVSNINIIQLINNLH